MSSPTSSHPKIIVSSEYAQPRRPSDLTTRTPSQDSTRTSASSSTTNSPSRHHSQSHNPSRTYHHHHHHHEDEDQDEHDPTHPGTRVNTSEMHNRVHYDDHREGTGDMGGMDVGLQMVEGLEEERKRRKRDYAVQLSRIMGRQLVSGISKGSRGETRSRSKGSGRG
ncbi:hypothetical protein K504DRAFT_464848 [Pleomassaria siparia CBS 279.74]|uniref:Uncharacterized protein n=1 Tax=Pleomassaria siparia CBS 279.74 TaxID=1314801 RepID=A0A6G1KJI2_9PLEO|nr:hypothetical protein K504DRAFT_464848 [Pleomassaria siparia CBS 279.74]